MTRQRRIVTVGHSYAVAQNRRLAHEMARAGGGTWDVLAVAPAFVQGDMRSITLERTAAEACTLEAVPLYMSRHVHIMMYGTRLREILQGDWDIVHCWEEPYVVAGAQVARWSRPSSRFVFWTYQNIAKRYPPPFTAIERYCLHRADGWLACGNTVAAALGPRGYEGKPHAVIPLGVDTNHFRPDANARENTRSSMGWSADASPVVGYLGRFVPEKGLTMLMRVLDQVSTPWNALFVGGGPLESALHAWAARHGDRVRIVTGVSHDDVPHYLNAMDILAAPSQSTPAWREQFGRMLIEAFACGVPVVASDSGEIPFVVGAAGVVLGEHDEADWIRTLSNLLESPCARAGLSRQGLDRAHERYAWPVIAARHLGFFEQLLDMPRARDS